MPQSNITIVFCLIAVMKQKTTQKRRSVITTRSRTVNNRIISDRIHGPGEELRDITKQAECTDKKTKKHKRGERVGGIGGGELTSSIIVEDTEPTTSAASKPTTSKPTTRSVGQTCQPRMKHKSEQIRSCLKCKEMGHIAITCSLKTDESHRPSALYCNQCKLTHKTTPDDTMVVEIKLCSAHRVVRDTTDTDNREAPISTAQEKKRETAVLLLQKVDRMVAAGTPLHTAVTILGLTEEKYNKLKKLC